MEMVKLIFNNVCYLCISLALHFNYAQTKKTIAPNTHPRGLVLTTEIGEIQDKIAQEPFTSMFAWIKKRTETTSITVYDQAERIADQSFIYLLTKDKQWSKKCYKNIQRLSKDTLFVKNPVSKGLTRAYILKQLAIAYDFCYQGWNDTERRFVNHQIYELMLSVGNSMGMEANYNAESNWMGVRYGSVVLAANIIDDGLLGQAEVKTRKAYLWDAQKRLQDHMEAGFTENGWFSETLGYHEYNGSFILPAIISLQNASSFNPAFELSQYAPQLEHSIDQHITSAVNIPNISGVGLKPDLGDDHPMLGSSLFSYGVRLMSEQLKPYLKWMLDYLYDREFIQDPMLYICFYPQEIEPMNPKAGAFLNYVDETQGVVLFRNRFKDENDIVACFNTSSHRVNGHSGPDNLTFRIIGLGSLWAVGGGRTREVAGQTNLFPAGNWQEQKEQELEEGTLVDYHFESDGSGHATGTCSSMGVQNHRRKFTADYSGKNGAAAFFVVEDTSGNGTTWRLNTPEFNTVEPLSNGFLLTAPNGSSLKATVIGTNKVNVTIGKIRYGGSTIKHNTFYGKKYSHNKTIDINCNGNIKVVMTLQPEGVPHPTF